MEDFIIKAAVAAVMIAIISGSLGCFVIWKRLSYFSESISHTALLGISLGLASSLGVHFGLMLVAVLFAVLIVVLQQRNFLSNDAILGIFSHIALSVGIVVLGLIDNANTDYFSFLFGDILSINNVDILWLAMVLLVNTLFLSFFWQPLLLLTLNQELAKAEGMSVLFYQFVFMIMIALAVSVSVQIVGVLLITSLLIIPPAVAKAFARTPFQMVLVSVLIAMLAVLIGLTCSAFFDIATGPAIVIVLGVLFAFSQFFKNQG